MKKLFSRMILLFFLFLLPPSALFAGMARDYIDVPVWSIYPAYYFTYSETKASADATRIDTFSNLFRVTGTFGILGKCSGWNLLVPVETVKYTNNSGTSYERTGVGDPSFVWDINIFGGPALSKEEYKTFKAQNYMSFHFTVTFPIGDYGPDNPVNIGSNRFSFSPLLNYSITPDEGKLWIEFYVKMTFYTDNDRYQGLKKMSQDPALNIEFHISYNFAPWLWLAMDLFYNFGGQTAVNGVWQNNIDNTLQGGVTINFTPWHHGKILIQYRDTIYSPPGSSQTRSVTCYIAQLF